MDVQVRTVVCLSTVENELWRRAYSHRLPMGSYPSSCAIFRRSKQATRRDCLPTNNQESEVVWPVLGGNRYPGSGTTAYVLAPPFLSRSKV